MQEELLPYYVQELRFIRRMGVDFARKYPAIASRLELEPDKCDDPHVERLIEAFALLSARVRHKIDDEFPEITQAFLNILYPHYLRPVPSMAIMQLELDRDQSKVTSGYHVPKDSELLSRPVTGVNVQFQTAYRVTLWPIEVMNASFIRASALSSMSLPSGVPVDAFAAIRIGLRTFGGAKFSEMDLNRLRFYLNGGSEITYTLHELLFNNAFQLILRDPRTNVSAILERNFLHEVGYGREEGLLPYEERSFLGYRLLQEYFCFPQKFLFFDLSGFERIAPSTGEQLEVLILLKEFTGRDRLPQLERSVNVNSFLLGCTPAVNLFERQAEPIRVTETDTEYRVVGDRYHELSTEVYSIERVISSRPDTEEVIRYEPFYSFRHSYVPEPKSAAFWIANRRESFIKGDHGTEVYLCLVDLGFRPTVPPTELLTVRVKCTNRDLPAKLPVTIGSDGEFEMTSGPMVRVRCRYHPTETLRPKSLRGLQWRLISHLALNELSIVEGREAFQELLKLYDFSDSSVVRDQIEGILSVTSAPHVARVTSENGVVMCLGTRVEMEFDENKFVGTSAFLMASVIERFIGLYSSVNSFSQLTVKSRQRKGLLKQWPPRAGEQILL